MQRSCHRVHYVLIAQVAFLLDRGHTDTQSPMPLITLPTHRWVYWVTTYNGSELNIDKAVTLQQTCFEAETLNVILEILLKRFPNNDVMKIPQ